ncbi:MAG: hypothetical protein O2782_21070 [bacterium]|nr:hypothetical protein [bacterium]
MTIFGEVGDTAENLGTAVADKVTRRRAPRPSAGTDHVTSDGVLRCQALGEHADGSLDVVGHAQNLADEIRRTLAQKSQADALQRNPGIDAALQYAVERTGATGGDDFAAAGSDELTGDVPRLPVALDDVQINVFVAVFTEQGHDPLDLGPVTE